MKRQWTTDELVEHWTLRPSDLALVANKAEATQLGCALLLKAFQYEGRFPQSRGEVPTAAVVHVARQLGVPPECSAQYVWTGRTIELHRAQIRQALGFREATVQDADDLTTWLCQAVLPHDRRPERLQAAVYARCQAGRIEPPAAGRIDRIIRSALRVHEDALYRTVLERVGPAGLVQIDALLAPAEATDGSGEARPPGSRDLEDLTLHELKTDPGRMSVDNVFAHIDRLRRVRQLVLGAGLGKLSPSAK
jgi:hypothetical protein